MRHLPSRRSFQLASPDPVPEGRRPLRYEFEPTGEPDIRHGKGVPGRGQLYVDGHLVANTEFPYTSRSSSSWRGSAAATTSAHQPARPTSHPLNSPDRFMALPLTSQAGSSPTARRNWHG